MGNFINENLDQYLNNQKKSQDGIAKIKHIYSFILSLIDDKNLYSKINEYVKTGQEIDLTAIFFDNLSKPNEYENYLNGIKCIVELNTINEFQYRFEVKKVYNKREVVKRVNIFKKEIE